MYVKNVAGYNFAFKYREAVIYIPSDGKIYSIPDDSGLYRELRVIPAMHVRTQNVTYINKDGSVASSKISGHKRRGRPPKVVDPVKPLKGVKLKPKVVEKVEEPIEDNSVMDIDLDLALDPQEVVKDVEIEVDDKPVEKVTPKAPAKKTPAKKKAPAKKTTGNKRGRPAKKSK